MRTWPAFFGTGNTRILRVLLLGDILSAAAAQLVSLLVDPRLLPADLRDYAFSIPADDDIGETALTVIVGCVFGAFFAVMATAVGGLWRLRRWARVLYVLIAFIFIGSSLVWFAQPVVYTGLSSTIWSIGASISGAILLMVCVFMCEEFKPPSRGSAPNA